MQVCALVQSQGCCSADICWVQSTCMWATGQRTPGQPSSCNNALPQVKASSMPTRQALIAVAKGHSASWRFAVKTV